MKKVTIMLSACLFAGMFIFSSCHSKKDLVVVTEQAQVPVVNEQVGVIPVTVEVAKTTGKQMQVQEKELVKALAIFDAEEVDGDTIITVDLVPDLKNDKLQAIKLGLNDSVLFKINSAELSTKADSVLSIVAASMVNFPETDATIVGYTSHTGPQAFNQELSVKRAQSVMKYLATKGVNASRMEAIGRGWNDPVASNKTLVGRSLNRRVEIYITVGQQMIQKAAKK
ncbi:MAG: OmpA family protein [Bacteroidales bacterium]